MPERHTAETLRADADARVALRFEPKPTKPGSHDFVLSPKGWWGWNEPGGYWWPVRQVSTDANAWPEVHKALEEQEKWLQFVSCLYDQLHERIIGKGVGVTRAREWSDYVFATATAADFTAALLNMEAQRA